MSNTVKAKNVIDNRWKTKDFITLAIFNIIILVILNVSVMVANLLFTPTGAFYIGGVLPGLVGGPFYLVMANRIGKRGVLFLSMLLAGIMFATMGFVYYLIAFVVLGLIGELAMLGKNSYAKTVRNTIGYCLYTLSFELIGVFPLLFFREQYLALMGEKDLEQVLLYGQPGPLAIASLIIIVCSLGGCLIGTQILKRHVKKAKLI